jgi:hypothetical protein
VCVRSSPKIKFHRLFKNHDTLGVLNTPTA